MPPIYICTDEHITTLDVIFFSHKSTFTIPLLFTDPLMIRLRHGIYDGKHKVNQDKCDDNIQDVCNVSRFLKNEIVANQSFGEERVLCIFRTPA